MEGREGLVIGELGIWVERRRYGKCEVIPEHVDFLC